jgi:hypothetical protein
MNYDMLIPNFDTFFSKVIILGENSLFFFSFNFLLGVLPIFRNHDVINCFLNE